MTRPVVITRPEAQSAPLAARLRALGQAAIVFPLLDIQPLPDPTALQAALSRLHTYAMVAFVSPNAIDAVFARLTHWPAGVIAAVVGEGSRQALARHGLTAANAQIVSPVDPHRTDSETLVDALELDALRGARALIIRAETGRELLADRLRDAGIEVEQVAAYRRSAPPMDAERRSLLQRLLVEDNDWIVTSSEALRILRDSVYQIAGAPGWRAMSDKQLIVPHQRIADTASSLGFCRVILTDSGDEALVAAIQSRP